MARSTTASKSGAAAGVFATPVSRDLGGGLLVYLGWFIHLGAFLFVALAMVSFSPSDWPSHATFPHNDPPANWCGVAGAVPAYYLFRTLGWGAWMLVGLWGLYVIVSGFVTRVSHAAVRLIGAAIMAVSFAALQGLLLPGTGPLADLHGGTLGSSVVAQFVGTYSTVGTALVLLLGLLVGAVVALDVWVVLAPVWAYRQVAAVTPPVAAATVTGAKHTATWMGRSYAFLAGMFARPEAPAKGRPTTPSTPRPKKDAKVTKRPGKSGETPGAIDENAGGLGATEAFDPEDHVVLDEDEDVDEIEEAPTPPTPLKPAKQPKAAGKGAPKPGETPLLPGVAAADADGTDDEGDAGDPDEGAEPAAAPARKAFTPEELRAKIAKLPLRFASDDRKAATQDDLRDIQNTAELPGYLFPGLDLLEEPEPNYPEKLESFVREQATALEKALKEYRIDGEVVGIESGPVITMYEARLAPGTKVAAISAVASDLARALRAINIRIVPNMQGRDTVGIEVPNPHKEKVRLKELMGKSDKYASMTLPMFLGKDASGEPLIADLAAMPHMLIAGTTGSGKSVCMSSILMSFLYTKKPNELKLVLVDPKMVELSQFKDVPHLMCPVVTEMGKAAAILEWAVRKMDERYELLVEAGCRDINGYNALTWEELKERFHPEDEVEEARIPKRLPYMVFVIDELADLMMTNKEVEHSIVRIAQKARAVGMHLIVATQRPQANVVTGLIKSNMPARVAFKVASGMDSRIVLDQKGGELLLGQGDMLYLSPRSSKLTRAQGTLVDDREIRKVVKFLKEIAEPTFERSLMQIRTGASAGGGLEDDGDNAEVDGEGNDGLLNAQADPLFDKAVEIVLETKIGSVSMLQRRLAIGYTRSSRLIDAMGKAGIIGDHKGTVAREVTITPDEWAAMKAQAEADAAAAAAAPTAAPDDASLFPAADPAPPASTTSAPKAKLPRTAGPPPGAGNHHDDDPELSDDPPPQVQTRDRTERAPF